MQDSEKMRIICNFVHQNKKKKRVFEFSVDCELCV